MPRSGATFRAQRQPVISSVSFGAQLGANERILPQLLDPKQAEKVVNLLIDGQGQLKKRKGLSLIATKTGITGFSAGAWWFDNTILVGYDTTVARVDVSTGVLTEIKTNFTANVTDIATVGDFAWVATGVTGEKLYRIDKATFTPTLDTNAPTGKQLFIRTSEGGGNPGVRLFVGQADNTKDVIYTKTDVNATVPWSTAADWDTTLTPPDSAGIIRGQDDVQTITSRGNSFVIGYQNARATFRITTSQGVSPQSQDVVIDWQYLDHGMERGAIDTSQGTFYIEKGGVRRLKSTTSEDLISINLGKDFFKLDTLTNADLVHDTLQNLVLVTFAKQSTVNNQVFTYNLDTGAISLFEGWNLNKFIKLQDGSIYGLSANDGNIFKLFTTNSDNGKNIRTELVQSIQRARLDATSVLTSFEIQTELVEGETIDIKFDIEDAFGKPQVNAQVWTITGLPAGSPSKSWGTAGQGTSGYGTGVGASPVVPRKYHTDDLNLEFINAKVKIVSNTKTAQTLNFYIAKITEGNAINLNNITQTA